MNRMHLTMQLEMNSMDVELLVPYYSVQVKNAGLSEQQFYGQKFKCLWLLHGLGGVAGDWLRNTMAEVFAEEKQIFVICPEGRCGYYTDCPEGEEWETRITETVWKYLHTIFPMMSDRPEDNMVAGNSMGGYGAARFALAHPDKFGFAACLSGGLNVPQRYAEGESINGRLNQAFGKREDVVGSDYDLYVLAKRLAENSKVLPRFYISCGTLDWEYDPNSEFCNYMKALGYQVKWDEGEFGHEWRFWNAQIEKALNEFISKNLVSSRAERGEMK